MQQQQFVLLRPPHVVYSNNQKQSRLLVSETKQGSWEKHQWFKLSRRKLIVPGQVMNPKAALEQRKVFGNSQLSKNCSCMFYSFTFMQ